MALFVSLGFAGVSELTTELAVRSLSVFSFGLRLVSGERCPSVARYLGPDLSLGRGPIKIPSQLPNSPFFRVGHFRLPSCGKTAGAVLYAPGFSGPVNPTLSGAARTNGCYKDRDCYSKRQDSAALPDLASRCPARVESLAGGVVPPDHKGVPRGPSFPLPWVLGLKARQDNPPSYDATLLSARLALLRGGKVWHAR